MMLARSPRTGSFSSFALGLDHFMMCPTNPRVIRAAFGPHGEM